MCSLYLLQSVNREHSAVMASSARRVRKCFCRQTNSSLQSQVTLKLWKPGTAINDIRSIGLPSQITSSYNIAFPGNSRATSVFSARQARRGRATIAQSVERWAAGSIPGKTQRICIISTASGPALRHIQWTPGGMGGVQGPETTLIRLVPRSRIMEVYLHSPIRLHSHVIN
jgi:hypothetical protein